MSETGLILLVMPVLMLLSGVFSGSETALFGLTYHDRSRLMKLHPGAGRAVEKLLGSPKRLLITVLLGNMVINVLYFVLSSLLLMRASDEGLVWLGVVANVASVVGLILVGEIFAKLIASRDRVRFARLVVWPLAWMTRWLGGVLAVIERGVISPLARLMGATEQERRLGVEELGSLVELSAEQGEIDASDEQLVGRVLWLGSISVQEVMTPRGDMAMIARDAAHEEARAVMEMHRDEPVLVHAAGDRNEVLGVFNAKRYFALAARGMRVVPGVCVDRVCVVPEQARLDSVLHVLRESGTSVAVVVDEYGAVVGVTVIERIAGQLHEDFGTQGEFEDEPLVRLVALGTWDVSGRMSVRTWTKLLGQELTTKATTVGGVVMAQLGRLPRVGDEVQIGNVTIQVMSVRPGAGGGEPRRDAGAQGAVARAMIRLTDLMEQGGEDGEKGVGDER